MAVPSIKITCTTQRAAKRGLLLVAGGDLALIPRGFKFTTEAELGHLLDTIAQRRGYKHARHFLLGRHADGR